MSAGRARAATTTSSPIVKPLPAEWFIDYGTNAEMRWDAVPGLGYFIPGERFFVRDHTSTPLIDASTWTLSLWGDGLRGSPTQANPVSLNYEQLRRLPSVEVPSFIECAGNGRSFFNTQQGTPAPGTQWGLEAIGVGNWCGVPLAEVLERAGVVPGAVDIMPAGLDPDYVTGGVDYGPVRRPLPIAKAFENTILAYELNGEPLPPDNGYPVRLVVPGWVGVANIKWVGQIQVSRDLLYSYWNTTNYILEGAAYPTPIPLSTQVVKSAFELAFNATLPNQRLVLTGRSWSGLAQIKRVDISTDGGAGWRPARLSWPNLRMPGCAGSARGLRPARGATRSRPAPATGPDEPSPRPFHSTCSATCSGQPSSTR